MTDHFELDPPERPRRALPIVIAIVAAVVLVIAGIVIVTVRSTSGTDAAGTSTASGEPVTGGTLVFAQNALPANAKGTGYPEQNFLVQVLDSFLSVDGEGEIVGHLATAWEVSEDGLTYDLTLRTDVTFSDGTPFTAEIAQRNLDRYGLGDETTGYPKQARFIGYESTEIVDDQTIRIHLSTPNPELLGILADAKFGVVGEATLDLPDYDSQTELTSIVGTGPFVLDSFVPDQEIVLVRREDYAWAPSGYSNQGAAYLDEVVIRAIPELGLRAGAVTAGEVDLAQGIQPTDEAGLVSSGDTVYGATLRQATTNYALIRPASSAAAADPQVRHALQIGFDRQGLVDTVLSSSYAPATSFWGVGTPGYEDLSEEFAYDADEANRLLDDAGWTERDTDGFRTKDGQRLSFSVAAASTSVAIRPAFEYIEQQWRALGIELLDYAGDDTAWNAAQTDTSYGLLAVRNPLVQALSAVTTRGGYQDDTQLAALVAGAQTAPDLETEERYLQEYARYLIDQDLVIPIFDEVQVYGGSGSLAISFTATASPYFQSAWIAGS